MTYLSPRVRLPTYSSNVALRIRTGDGIAATQFRRKFSIERTPSPTREPRALAGSDREVDRDSPGLIYGRASK